MTTGKPISRKTHAVNLVPFNIHEKASTIPFYCPKVNGVLFRLRSISNIVVIKKLVSCNIVEMKKLVSCYLLKNFL